MRVFCTGISGTNKRRCLEDTLDLAKLKDKQVKIYHPGSMIDDLAKNVGISWTKENVLAYHRNTLRALSGIIYEKISTDLNEKENAIINSHALFYKNNYLVDILNIHDIKKIHPNLFVTFIDNAETIKKRLTDEDHKKQWGREFDEKEQGISKEHTIERILHWQEVEVQRTKDFASMLDVKHYVLPVEGSKDTLYILMFKPEARVIYLSIPITHLSSERGRAEITGFAKELESYGILINPLSIDLNLNKTQSVNNYLFKLGSEWFIDNADVLVAFHPSEGIRTPGQDGEIQEGAYSGKDVYGVYPEKFQSPWIKKHCTYLDSNKEAFFERFERNGYKRLNLEE